jgi:hypothetical protein
MRALLLIGALLLMGGCTIQFPINLPGSLQSQPAPDLAVNLPGKTVQTCLPKVEYTPDQQKAFDKELAQLPDNPIILQYLADYHAMRDAADLCLKHTTK